MEEEGQVLRGTQEDCWHGAGAGAWLPANASPWGRVPFTFGLQASQSPGVTSEGTEGLMRVWGGPTPMPSWWRWGHFLLLQGDWLGPSQNAQLQDLKFYF